MDRVHLWVWMVGMDETRCLPPDAMMVRRMALTAEWKDVMR